MSKKTTIRDQYQYSSVASHEAPILRSFGWLVNRKSECINDDGKAVCTVRRDVLIASDPEMKKAEKTYLRYKNKAQKKMRCRHIVGQLLAALFALAFIALAVSCFVVGDTLAPYGSKNFLKVQLWGELVEVSANAKIPDKISQKEFEKTYDKKEIKSLNDYMKAYNTYIGLGGKRPDLYVNDEKIFRDEFGIEKTGLFLKAGSVVTSILNKLHKKSTTKGYYTPKYDAVTVTKLFVLSLKIISIVLAVICLLALLANSARYKRRMQHPKRKYAQKYREIAEGNILKGRERLRQLKGKYPFLIACEDREIAGMGNMIHQDVSQ